MVKMLMIEFLIFFLCESLFLSKIVDFSFLFQSLGNLNFSVKISA